MGARSKIIVTGGAGYIGSHTIVELLGRMEQDIVSIDNFSNSSSFTLDRIHRITGKKVRNYDIDLCDKAAVSEVLEVEGNVDGVIHFAAFKSVPESMSDPYKYYQNNVVSLLNVLQAVLDNDVANFIFSSSCSVYGNIERLPVNENTPLGHAQSPYAATKQMGERIVADHAAINDTLKAISLRYFNPVGAHRSGQLGEDPINPPTSLVPVITRTATGRMKELVVHGNDYDTRDGSCIRDYVHVSDIAAAHVHALQYALSEMKPGHEIYNLGTGKGVSVLEAIHAFEKVTGRKLNYRIGPKREGDVGAIYSDTERSRTTLRWEAQIGLEEMMSTAFAWEEELIKEQGVDE